MSLLFDVLNAITGSREAPAVHHMPRDCRSVLIHLANRAGKDGVYRFGLDLICDDADLGIVTVRKCIAELLARGWLKDAGWSGPRNVAVRLLLVCFAGGSWPVSETHRRLSPPQRRAIAAQHPGPTPGDAAEEQPATPGDAPALHAAIERPYADRDLGPTRGVNKPLRDPPADPPRGSTRSGGSGSLPLFGPSEAAVATPVPGSQVQAKRPKKKTAPAEPKRTAADRYAEAWQKGHAAAGYPVSPPTKNERDLLGMIAATHARYHDGTPITGDALIRWFEEQAEDFRRAFGDVPKIRGGMSPMGFRAWLDDRGAGGRMQAPLAPPKPKRPLDEHEDPDDDARCPEEDEDFGPPLPPSRTIAILESFGLHEGARAVREAHPELAEEAANG